MRVFLLFNFWLFLQEADSLKFNIKSTHHENLAIVLEEIIEGFFFKFTDVINLVTVKNSVTVLDVKQNLLKTIFHNPKVTVRQETATDLHVVTNRRRRTAILLIESFDDFHKFYEKMSRKLFLYNGHYLLAFVNGEIPEMAKIFALLWKVQTYKVLVVFEACNDTVQIQTFIPFASWS